MIKNKKKFKNQKKNWEKTKEQNKRVVFQKTEQKIRVGPLAFYNSQNYIKKTRTYQYLVLPFSTLNHIASKNYTDNKYADNTVQTIRKKESTIETNNGCQPESAN